MTNPYISKDFIHQGCGLIINPEIVWQKISYSVRNKINKAINNNVIVKRLSGSKEDLQILRQLWYNPNDPNLPELLTKDDYMFIAYLDEEPVGVIVLLPVLNHLFLNNLASSQLGKKYGVQDYLLWYSVNYLEKSNYKYIDVGVSYRKSLYEFFSKWAVFHYPVIFNKPEILRPIFLKPFKNYDEIIIDFQKIEATEKMLFEVFDTEEITFVPNVEIAKNIIINYNQEPKNITNTLVNNDKNQYFYVDLTDIFSTQFGALIINLKIDDKDLWNVHKSFDYYKRNLVYSQIYNELSDLEKILELKQNNYNIFKKYFEIDGIQSINNQDKIKITFNFISTLNQKFNQKLIEFQVEHLYDEKSNIIQLPVHQNLTKYEIDLIYGIFRGVLNLCSEWVYTGVNPNYK